MHMCINVTNLSARKDRRLKLFDISLELCELYMIRLEVIFSALCFGFLVNVYKYNFHFHVICSISPISKQYHPLLHLIGKSWGHIWVLSRYLSDPSIINKIVKCVAGNKMDKEYHTI